MEADWEVEIGNGAPVIDACWDGLIDLRSLPDRAASLPEVLRLPALEPALVGLNSPSSPVWTAKCDVWEPTEFDPYELDAAPEGASYAIACYMDLLPRSEARWNSADQAIADCRAICARLKSATLTGCRADLIVRKACLAKGRAGLGITAYLTACGPTPNDAADVLGNALEAFVQSVPQG